MATTYYEVLDTLFQELSRLFPLRGRKQTLFMLEAFLGILVAGLQVLLKSFVSYETEFLSSSD